MGGKVSMIRQIITIALLLCISFICNAQEIYVVTVGINQYGHPDVSKLKLPENDADSIGNLYSKKTNHIARLKGCIATRENIIKTIRAQFARAEENDMIVFFFSGHGYKGGICPYDFRNAGGLSYDYIKKLFKESKAKTKIIMVDGCFSGGIREKSIDQPKEVNYKTTQFDQGVMLFLSSRDEETSLESSGMNNGYFTSSVIQGLRGKADRNKDKIITAAELFLYVSKDVSVRTANRQHPVMWGKFHKNMWLMDLK